MSCVAKSALFCGKRSERSCEKSCGSRSERHEMAETKAEKAKKVPGTISKKKREEIGYAGSPKREDIPASVFLKPGERKYPVKSKQGGEWKYDRDLLLAAARRARLNNEPSIA